MKRDIIELRNSKDNVFVTVYFDEKIEATVDIWKGPFENSENFQTGLYHVLQNIKKNRSVKWLADISKIEGSFEHSREWIAKKIVPEAKEYGLKYEALVLPDNIFSMLSVQETLEVYEDSVIIRVFGTQTDAIQWLDSKV